MIISLVSRSSSHSENTCLGVLNRCIERDSDAETENSSQVLWLDDAIVPQARSGIVGAALRFVICHDSVLELLNFHGVSLILELDEAEHFTSLGATHDRNL